MLTYKIYEIHATYENYKYTINDETNGNYAIYAEFFFSQFSHVLLRKYRK